MRKTGSVKVHFCRNERRRDVLMTTEAPLGCIARLDRDDVAFAQRLLTLRGKKGVLDNDFFKILSNF